MAGNEPQDTPRTPTKKEPYGPGVLLIFGLALLLVAGWCLLDLTTRAEWHEEGRTGTIVMNWIGLIAGAAAAIYCFALAAVRSRKAGPKPPVADAPG